MADSNNTHHYTLTPGNLGADISLTLPTTQGTLALTSYVSANPGSSGGGNITAISIGGTDYSIPDTNTEYTAGNGLDLSTTEFGLDLKANSGLVIDNTELSLDLGATGISGTLSVSDGGTGATTFTSNALLTGNGASAISSESNLSFDTDTLTIDGSSGGKLKMADSNNTHHYTLTPGDLSGDISLTLPTTQGTLALTSYVSANPGSSGGGNITTISIGGTDYSIPDTNTEYTAGNGLDLSTTEFSLDLKANTGLVIDNTELSIDLGASGISGTLSVSDGGTGATTFTSNALLTGNGASAISSENNLSFDTDTLTIDGSSVENSKWLTVITHIITHLHQEI